MSAAPNRDQAEAWNGDSGIRWAATADLRDQVLAPVAQALLHRAAPSGSEQVLDVGSGCGATTIAAASAVGTSGSALGIDLSKPMLQIARQRSADAGLCNIEFVEGDGQTHAFEPGSADLAISRFGTMFFNDPRAAFANIGAGMADGGRLCIATWQPLAANEWLLVPGAVLLRYTELPAEGPPTTGMFAQSDPQVIVDLLQGAGFRDVETEAVELGLNLGRTAEDAATYLADTGPGRKLLDAIPVPATREEALAAVVAELSARIDADGVHLAAGILLTAARWHH